MIFIRPASSWNPRDFIAAKLLREDAGASPISWREHCTWWTDGSYTYLYFLQSNRRRIGYVRADRSGIVSIAITPQYQRQGYGLTLLHHLRSEVRGALIAYISSDNTASLALFKRAGYSVSTYHPTARYFILVNYE